MVRIFHMYSQTANRTRISVEKPDISVIKSVRNRFNDKVTKSVVATEAIQMFMLRTHYESHSVVGDLILENDGKIKQERGAGIWSLADDFGRIPTDDSEYEGSDGDVGRMDLYIPPVVEENLAEHYGQRWGRQLMRQAIEFYMNQPFWTLNHVLAVQRDVMKEQYETEIGSHIDRNSDMWHLNMESSDIDQWADAYNHHVVSNTPETVRVDWLTEAFRNVDYIDSQRVFSEKVVRNTLEDTLDFSEKDARMKADQIDIDEINAEWYDDVADVLDSDVAERATSASDLIEIMDHPNQLNLLNGRPEETVDEQTQQSATVRATGNYPYEVDWTGMTWESRVSIACEFLESECEAQKLVDGVTIDDLDVPDHEQYDEPEDDTEENMNERMSQFRSAGGDNQ